MWGGASNSTQSNLVLIAKCYSCFPLISEIGLTVTVDLLVVSQESKVQVESELSDMTAALDSEDSEETELKKQMIEEKNKLDTFEASVKDNVAKTRHWKKEVRRQNLVVVQYVYTRV